MTLPANAVSFAMVASRGYIGHAAGLITNLREFYPETEIIVCAQDEQTRRAFANCGDANVTCATGEDVWGPANWRNITSRMSVPERAFASKSALCAWAVETRDRPVLLLDSDLLFLSAIDDVVKTLTQHGLMLVPGRHPWQDWRKTARFGLFSAGVIGIGPAGLRAAQAWRAMCFEACIASPFAGTYYEQKYLDYFVSDPSLKILNDPGINVSQTLLGVLTPEKDADGAWRVAGGTPLRMYHSSRSTDESMELARMKADYNRRGLEAFGLATAGSAPREERTGNRIGLAALVRWMRIGGALEALAHGLDGFTRRLLLWHRVLTLKDHTLRERMAEAKRRHDLHRALEDRAFSAKAADPEAP